MPKWTSLKKSYCRGLKWTETWWEAPMEGSVLSFLKAEWKVSDTGSAHWASSFAMLGDSDLIFGIWVYNDELQIKFTFRSGPMIFGRIMACRVWNLAKYLVVATLFHYDLRYWLDFWYECIIISYRSTFKFVTDEWFLASLQPSGFEIWPNI